MFCKIVSKWTFVPSYDCVSLPFPQINARLKSVCAAFDCLSFNSPSSSASSSSSLAAPQAASVPAATAAYLLAALSSAAAAAGPRSIVCLWRNLAVFSAAATAVLEPYPQAAQACSVQIAGNSSTPIIALKMLIMTHCSPIAEENYSDRVSAMIFYCVSRKCGKYCLNT
jgi:hypothetical protein